MTNANYILIDYENVQPKDLDLVPSIGWEVKVFLGPKQNANHASLNAAQRLGANCQYISVLKAGPNALDFYIAYFLGTLSLKKAQFYVISKDTGFDPLLEQLTQDGIPALRCKRITDIPALSKGGNIGLAASEKPLLEQAIEDLARRNGQKPGTLKTLQNALRARFKLTDKQTADLVLSLQDKGLIRIEAQKVVYIGALDLAVAASKAT